MGKNVDPDLQQREQSLESGNHPGFLCGGCWMVLPRLSFKCVFVLFLSLSVLLSGIFWILPFRSINSGFDAKQAIKLSASVHAYFKLQKPVSDLVPYIEKLEYDIFEEIGVPATKVAILSMHQSGASNSADVVFGVLSDPVNSPINPVSLSVLRSSLIELFLQQSNLTLTPSIFGQPSKFEILKFPGGITVIPVQPAFIWPITQILFNFTLNNSVDEILHNFIQLKDQLKYGLHLRSYENLFVQLTNQEGSTISSPVIVQASVTSSDFGNLLPQRLKQLVQTITESPAKNLGLNNSVFGKVKSISLSSYLKGTLDGSPPTASPAPSPGPSISPTQSPASSPKTHHLQPCRKCKGASQSPGPRSGPYVSFPPLISPAPSTTAPPPIPYSRQAIPPRSHSSLIPHHPPAMSPRSQLSPDVPPLPSVSYGSRPGQGMDSGKGPVSAPLAQPPSSKAVSVVSKNLWLTGCVPVLIFCLLFYDGIDSLRCVILPEVTSHPYF
ncbi:hypothetical protein GQ457_01G045570 [Hibiscus cannabinus]